MKTQIRILFLSLGLLLSHPMRSYGNTQDSILSVLDEHLLNAQHYMDEKENRIHLLKMEHGSNLSDEDRYRNYSKLFEEYKSYKYDSAYVYASKSLQLAERMNNQNFIILSKTRIAFCLVSSGLFKEAFDAVKGLNVTEASTLARNAYYNIYTRLFYDLADYTQDATFKPEYTRQGGVYTDSLLQVLPTMSAEYQYAIAQREMKECHYGEAIRSFLAIQQRTDIGSHTRAIVSSCLGWMNLHENRLNEGIYYLAEAAINDIRSGVKETTALCTLARLLYQQGEIDRAVRYVRHALEDANFYNARHRKIEVGALLPIIEQERFDIVEGQRNMLIVFVAVVTVLFVLLLAATTIIYKQIKKLRDARSTIETRNRELTQANHRLSEANTIKDEYIGNSFYVNAEYINRMENLYKLINRKVAAHQYDDLKQTFNMSQLNKERETMYTSFDETFLKLFPNFVDAYNALFPEEEQASPEAGTLTPEMRIFALIRLGITKPDRIAKFLNYSVNTINTYKTRVKNKSMIANEEFEARIMEIASTY